ncbi:MAG: thioredoxin domain-containing protein [Candidatus Gastranaerophilales bacterium]|nr:thioredoxin domain-containing protein [Candidatus Gastranaerophilales bacterium]
MKKFLMIGLIVVAVVLTSAFVWAFSPKKNLKPSEYDIGITYASAMKAQKPFIALFYADWCTYCIKFMPRYKMLSDIYKDKYNFVMINVDNSSYGKVINDYDISGFPTIYIIDPTIDNRILINNALYGDLAKLRTEFDRYLRIRAMIKSEKCEVSSEKKFMGL